MTAETRLRRAARPRRAASPAAQVEAHVDRRADVVLVVLDLRLGQRRPVGDAPVHRLLRLVDEAALRERRPARARSSPGTPGPSCGTGWSQSPMTPSRSNSARWMSRYFVRVRAARLAERDRAHLPLLRAEVLVDPQLDRQAVAVPARHVGRVEAREAAAAHHHVLEDLVERGAEVDVAVRVRRAVVQDELRRALPRRAHLPVEVLAPSRPRMRRGSAWGRLAFMGNAVCGRLSVDLRSMVEVIACPCIPSREGNRQSNMPAQSPSNEQSSGLSGGAGSATIVFSAVLAGDSSVIALAQGGYGRDATVPVLLLLVLAALPMVGCSEGDECDVC